MQDNNNNVVKLSFHLFASIHFAYGCYYDWNYVKIPEDVHIMGLSYAGKLKFLTYWDAVLQAVFYIICVLNDCFGSNSNAAEKRTPFICRIRDITFTCLAFPVAMFVGLTFWGLYAVDRELVFPRSLDPFFPVWLNHVMHTNIMIFILIELFTSFRVYPKQKLGLSVLVGFMISYLIWMHVVYYKTEVWVYPVMEVLNTPLRICFFLILLGLAVMLYKLGDFLNTKIWGQNLRKLKSK